MLFNKWYDFTRKIVRPGSSEPLVSFSENYLGPKMWSSNHNTFKSFYIRYDINIPHICIHTSIIKIC